MATHRGSCHCGKLAFEVEGDIDKAMSCNCSICRRKGSLLWFTSRGNFTLHADESDVATYTFNKHVIKHRFCPHCGIHPFGEGVDREGNELIAVNVRCLEDFDLDAVEVGDFDGRSL